MANLDHKLVIYENNETKFTSFGLSVITDSYDIEIKQIINDEYSLRFTMPIKSKSYKYLKVGRFIKAYGTIFIVRSYEEFSQPPSLMVSVECEHIMFELIDEFVPKTTQVNVSAQYLLNDTLNGTRFIGVTSITGTYSLQLEKSTRLKNLDQLCDNTNGIRVCSDVPDANGFFTITLLPNEGVTKGYLVHNRKNLSSMKRTVNGKSVITRLYVYGADGITIETAVGGNGTEYMDSANISDYPSPKEGAVSFDSITDVNSLYEAGISYLEHASIPIISYEVDMEDLNKLVTTGPQVSDSELRMGDLISVIDEDLGITTKAKITALTWDPENGNMHVSLDATTETADEVIANIINSQETDTGVKTGNVWTEWLTIPFNNVENTILFGQKYKTKPTIMAHVYGSTEAVPIKVIPIAQIENGLDVFTGVTLTCATGTGTDIAIQAIGRV